MVEEGELGEERKASETLEPDQGHDDRVGSVRREIETLFIGGKDRMAAICGGVRRDGEEAALLRTDVGWRRGRQPLGFRDLREDGDVAEAR